MNLSVPLFSTSGLVLILVPLLSFLEDEYFCDLRQLSKKFRVKMSLELHIPRSQSSRESRSTRLRVVRDLSHSIRLFNRLLRQNRSDLYLCYVKIFNLENPWLCFLFTSTPHLRSHTPPIGSRTSSVLSVGVSVSVLVPTDSRSPGPRSPLVFLLVFSPTPPLEERLWTLLSSFGTNWGEKNVRW